MSDSISSPPDSGKTAALEPVFAAVRIGDLSTAKRLAREALRRGYEHPVLLNLRALEYEDAGLLRESLNDLRRAHFLAPGDFSILNACGLCLARMERREEALQCYDQALEIAPDFGPAWFNRGWVLERLGETAEAARCYAKAAEINPQNAQAWANLATLDGRRGDAQSARRHANHALEAQPGHPTAILALADPDVFDPVEAESLLRELLSTDLSEFDRALALNQLGDALDALDRPSEAFAAYAEGNALFRKANAPRFEAAGQPTVATTLSWLNGWAQTLPVGPWPDGVGGETTFGAATHVFLLGFPRSGTTLIESALAKHPAVISLEERDTLEAPVRAFMANARALDNLASVGPRELRDLRRDYWHRVRQFGAEPDGKIFIDKNPFNTLKLPIITRLFPDAKIIFAVRDPRDVVLSCFRRRFNFNASTYEYLDLERTATNYDGVMRLAEVLRGKLNFLEHRLTYERLVADFAVEARAVCDFIGAEWREDLIDFADRARRGDVASASGVQIARGLYSGGIGQWRRYERQLAPVMDILEPWVERFGYPSA